MSDWQIEEGLGESEEKEARLFPDKEQAGQRITCHDVTRDFLIYGTDVRDELVYFTCKNS